MGFDQLRKDRRGPRRIERLLRALERRFHLLASGEPLPSQAHPVEQVRARALTKTMTEAVGERAAPFGGSEALALVHAAALPRDLAVGASQQRIEAADVDLDPVARRVRTRARGTERVPH